MKKLFLILAVMVMGFLPSSFSATYNVVVTVTNAPGALTNATYTLNGSTRSWTTNANLTSLQMQITNTTAQAATNLYNSAVSISFGVGVLPTISNNVVTFNGGVGVSFTPSNDFSGWATQVILTNGTFGPLQPIQIPGSNLPPPQATNTFTRLANDINTYAPGIIQAGSGIFTGGLTYASGDANINLSTNGMGNLSGSVSNGSVLFALVNGDGNALTENIVHGINVGANLGITCISGNCTLTAAGNSLNFSQVLGNGNNAGTNSILGMGSIGFVNGYGLQFFNNSGTLLEGELNYSSGNLLLSVFNGTVFEVNGSESVDGLSVLDTLALGGQTAASWNQAVSEGGAMTNGSVTPIGGPNVTINQLGNTFTISVNGGILTTQAVINVVNNNLSTFASNGVVLGSADTNIVNVTMAGNDAIANGSLALPFGTVSNGIKYAASHFTLSASNPAAVFVHAGLYRESGLAMTNSHLSLYGYGNASKIEFVTNYPYADAAFSNQFSGGAATLGRLSSEPNNVLSNITGTVDPAITNGAWLYLNSNYPVTFGTGNGFTVLSNNGPLIYLGANISPVSLKNFYTNIANWQVGNYLITNAVSVACYGLAFPVSVTNVEVANLSFRAATGNTNPVLQEATYSPKTYFRDDIFDNTNANSVTIGTFWDDMYRTQIRGWVGVWRLVGGYLQDADMLCTNFCVQDAIHNYGPTGILDDPQTRLSAIDGGRFETTATNGIALSATMPYDAGDSDPRVVQHARVYGNIWATNASSVAYQGHWWVKDSFSLTTITIQSAFDALFQNDAMFNTGANDQWCNQLNQNDPRHPLVKGGNISTGYTTSILTNDANNTMQADGVTIEGYTNGVNAWCQSCRDLVTGLPLIGPFVAMNGFILTDTNGSNVTSWVGLNGVTNGGFTIINGITTQTVQNAASISISSGGGSSTNGLVGSLSNVVGSVGLVTNLGGGVYGVGSNAPPPTSTNGYPFITSVVGSNAPAGTPLLAGQLLNVGTNQVASIVLSNVPLGQSSGAIIGTNSISVTGSNGVGVTLVAQTNGPPGVSNIVLFVDTTGATAFSLGSEGVLTNGWSGSTNWTVNTLLTANNGLNVFGPVTLNGNGGVLTITNLADAILWGPDYLGAQSVGGASFQFNTTQEIAPNNGTISGSWGGVPYGVLIFTNAGTAAPGFTYVQGPGVPGVGYLGNSSASTITNFSGVAYNAVFTNGPQTATIYAQVALVSAATGAVTNWLIDQTLQLTNTFALGSIAESVSPTLTLRVNAGDSLVVSNAAGTAASGTLRSVIGGP